MSKSDIGFYNYKENNSLTFPFHFVKTITDRNNANIPYSNDEFSFNYDHFRRFKTAACSDRELNYELTYGISGERVRSNFRDNNNDITRLKTYVGTCEFESSEIMGNFTSKTITYISTPSGVELAIVAESSQLQFSENTYILDKDYLGSLIGLTLVDLLNGTADVAYTFSYDAWGKMRNPDNWSEYTPMGMIIGFDILSRGFTGHEHLIEFGLINMNARVYDPEIAAFLSPDNAITYPDNPQNYNRYSYALNNPLKYTDPDGNHPLLIAMAIGAAVRSLSYSISAGDKWTWKGFGTAFAIGALEGALAYAGNFTAMNATTFNWGKYALGKVSSSVMNSVLPSKSIQIGSNISINVSTSFGFLDPISGNIDLSDGLNISATMRFTDDFSMTIGGQLGSHSSFSSGATYGNWSFYTTSYIGKYYQTIGGLGYKDPKSGRYFNFENDILAEDRDRYRTVAIEVGGFKYKNNEFAVGTQVFTSEEGKDITGENKNLANSFWGNNSKGTYTDGRVYRSPLYISINKTRVGWDNGLVQDFFQNGTHKFISKSPSFKLPDYNRFYYEDVNRRPGSLFSY